MAKKVASPELQSRVQRAIAMIGRGVNQSKPEVELEGRRQLALARIENEMILGRAYLTKEDVQDLAKVLFATGNNADADSDPEDYTADPTETNAEALARTPAPRIDADGDYDDEAEDL